MQPESEEACGSEGNLDEETTDPATREESYEGDKVLERSPKGRFLRFNRRLGAGAYKVVYLAFDNETGREVAWNVIPVARLTRQDRRRMESEIRVLSSLNHSRIIKFVSAWINREKSELVFITEVMSGGSLRAYIKRLDRPLKPKVIRLWCLQILEGISYLHNMKPQPIIHRDLKCDNIFVHGNEGNIVIGDLGLSTTFSTDSPHYTLVGTPEFMAPELYDESSYGPPVDMYAFGMCLLEMVSRGGSPYQECTTAGQIYRKVISGDLPSGVASVADPELKAIIIACLRSDPLARPTATELAASPYWRSGNPDLTIPTEPIVRNFPMREVREVHKEEELETIHRKQSVSLGEAIVDNACRQLNVGAIENVQLLVAGQVVSFAYALGTDTPSGILDQLVESELVPHGDDRKEWLARVNQALLHRVQELSSQTTCPSLSSL